MTDGNPLPMAGAAHNAGNSKVTLSLCGCLRQDMAKWQNCLRRAQLIKKNNDNHNLLISFDWLAHGTMKSANLYKISDVATTLMNQQMLGGGDASRSTRVFPGGRLPFPPGATSNLCSQPKTLRWPLKCTRSIILLFCVPAVA